MKSKIYLLSLSLSLGSAPLTVRLSAQVVYVNHAANGANNGTSWGNAYTSLQSALTTAVAGNDIWVAQGVYYPTDTDDRTISFVLKNGVALYGGFLGTETTPGQRDWESNITILSGDIDQDGIRNEGNSLHVVIGSGTDTTAVLDGFTITMGNAISGFGNGRGGGMFNDGGSPFITHCIFSGNSAFLFGGGMANLNMSSPVLTHVIFSDNSATYSGGLFNTHRGGGMSNHNNSSPTLTHCTFLNNIAGAGGGIYNTGSSPTIIYCLFFGNSANRLGSPPDGGGGIFNESSSPTISHCTFSGNSAPNGPYGDSGGGILNISSSSTITHCTFSGNTATFGGGIGNLGTNVVIISNCIFSGNTASVGGGVSNHQSAPTVITNSIFSGNSAASGGGMYNFNGAPTLTNCIFSGNFATNTHPLFGGGGAVRNESTFQITSSYINCTFSGNSAANGGAIFNFGSTVTTLTNSIIWNNSAAGSVTGTSASIYNQESSGYLPAVITTSYSIIANSGGSDHWEPAFGNDGGHNLDIDPVFIRGIDPVLAPTTYGDLRLRYCSPALDEGSNIANGEDTDLNGAPRVANGIIDLGANEYEVGQAIRLYVDAGAIPPTGGTNNGSSWEHALTDLEDALDMAGSDPDMTEIWVAAGEYYPTQNTVHTSTGPSDRNNTFSLYSCVEIYGGFAGNETLRSQRNWQLNTTTLSGDIDRDGLYNDGNCYHVVTGNGTGYSARLDGFTITGGRANGPEDRDQRGGGVHIKTGSPVMANCIISGNGALSDGGGMAVTDRSGPELTNMLISGNAAGRHGGGLSNENNSSLLLTNCTFSGNAAVSDGGGLYNSGGEVTLTNGIIWNNTAARSDSGTTASLYNDGAATALISYSLIANSGGSHYWDTALGTDGGHNIDVNPQFAGETDPALAPTATGNFRLLTCSPVVDAGLNSANQTDAGLGGNSRIVNDNIDLGAFEQDIPAGVIYVSSSASGNNSGTSWEHALTDLQAALVLACGETGLAEIWVAAGQYHPSQNTTYTSSGPADRTNTFTLCDCVLVYGGFAGHETLLGQRNWQTNITVLSGDIDGDGLHDDGNSYHVITGSGAGNSARLDGFTISGGMANGPEDLNRRGAGMINVNGSPALSNCIFSGNTALWDGGGMANLDLAAPVLTRVRFSGNTAGRDGGAMFNDNMPITSTMRSCTFAGNTAGRNGGGMCNSLSAPMLVNSLFSGNASPTGSGGGMCCENSSSPTLANCTFSGNLGASGGGGLYQAGNSSTRLVNTIIWNNATAGGTTGTSASIFNAAPATAFISNSLIANSGGSAGWNTALGLDEGHNTDTDPLFVQPANPAIAPVTTGNFRLQTISPAIDAGRNNANPEERDMDGNARIHKDVCIDLGPYEHTYGIVYVKSNATGSNNGNSWQHALTDLQAALAIACGNPGIHQVWVAAGTYYPAGPAGFPEATFQLCNDLAIYGGFAGHEAFFSQRDPQVNITILSGDIDRNGTLDWNSFHVVTGSGTNITAVLDGFTITMGSASEAFINETGAGMLNEGGSPYIANCIFSGNHAVTGGGMANWNGSSPVLTHVVFSENGGINGGGMYCSGNSSPILTGCTFSGNSAMTGGGMYCEDNSSPVLVNTVFTGNSAELFFGGGIFITNSSPSLTGCTLSGNTSVSGGGMYSQNSSPGLTNCTISGNSASSDGGGIYNQNSSPSLINCTISGNSAASDGGGIYNTQNSSPSLINCTISGNSTASDGGGICNTGGAGATIINSIVWNNAAAGSTTIPSASISNTVPATVVISYSIIANSRGSYFWDAELGIDGGYNEYVSPHFIVQTDPALAPTTAGDFRPIAGSPVIDAGLNTANGEDLDPDGKPRISNGAIDLGAYEYNGPRGLIVYVDIMATGNDDGSSWIHAFTDLQDALALACNDGSITQVWVAAGTYYPASQGGQNASFRLCNGTALYGGFAGNETLLSQRDWKSNLTILSGDIDKNNILNGGNSHNVVISSGTDPTARLDGFTITMGYHTGGHGGGILNINSSATIENCVVTRNLGMQGGGMANQASSPVVVNCVFSANIANTAGGGMANFEGSDVTLINCRFSGNHTGLTNIGGSNTTLINCTFSGNSYGAINNSMSWGGTNKVTLINCIVWNNGYATGGNLVTNHPFASLITNPGAITHISQSIIANSRGSGDDWITALGLDLGHNMDTDPHFLEDITVTLTIPYIPNPGGNFRLRACSPAIDAGHNSVNRTGTDADHYARFFNDVIDLGAYEHDGTPGFRVYVDGSATGNNDGSSWQHAYTDLQDALETACSADSITDIWVAAGTYYPSQNSTHTSTGPADRSNTFSLCNCVGLYGGFAGDETLLSQRNWQDNPTILSGDIDGDGIHNTGNSYHVVTGSGTGHSARLDGFTITGGWANGPLLLVNACGGGMFSEFGSPTVANCIFSGNSSFGGNNAGGGMANINYSHAVLNNVTFSGNSASSGGGMFNYGGSRPKLTGCIFKENSATGGTGGGMLNGFGGRPTLMECIFSGNTANEGGAINNNDNTSITRLINSTISGNTATQHGGGIMNRGLLSLTNTVVSGNTTADQGGGVYNTDITILTNTIVSGNTADNWGGGLFNSGGTTTLTNAVFSGNSSANIGGGIFNSSALRLSNCIIWNNQASGSTGTPGSSIFNNASVDDLNISHSLIANSGGSNNWDPSMGTDGGNNIDADPLFVTAANPASAPTIAGNFRLLPGSPAIDAGNNSADLDGPGSGTLTISDIFGDISGLKRIVNGDGAGGPVVDMGAYENAGCQPNPQGILYVNAAQTLKPHDGLSWTSAFSDLHEALTVACHCSGVSQVWVAGGVYYPGPADKQREASFGLCNGVAIYGGFTGTEWLLSQRDYTANTAVLSGNIGDPGIASDNAYHVVTGSGTNNTAVLDGFMITGGNANGIGEASKGAGIYINSGSPLIRHCIVTGNSANVDGGGLHNMGGSSPVVTNCSFVGNTAGFGGGVQNTGSNPTMINCVFSGNRAQNLGGGMDNYQGSGPALTNCTFSGNWATSSGGGMNNESSSSPAFNNCIIWNNRAGASTSSTSASVFNLSGSVPSFSYSLIANSGGSGSWNPLIGSNAGNNIDVDPLFLIPVDPAQAPVATGDLRLQTGSPAIDAGNNSATGISTPDLAKLVRITDGDANGTTTIDMGAYEHPGCPENPQGILYVRSDQGTATRDGLSWATAFSDLQDAMAAACNCSNVSQVWVASGTYYTGLPGRREATFRLCNGTALYGGFTGTETMLNQRDWKSNPTILSGDIDKDHTLDDENSYQVVTGTGTNQTAVLDGFTITGGRATGPEPFSNGGGMYTSNGSPAIANCIFSGNMAQGSGGGMANFSNSSPGLLNVTLSENLASVGAGMSNLESSPTIANCIFSGNFGVFGGGGMYNTNTSLPVITNSLFYGNATTGFGSGIASIISSSPAITNSSFSGNYAGLATGGAIYQSSGTATITNSILWGNSAEILLSGGGSAVVSYSIVQGGYSGVNNSDQDPLFTEQPSVSDLPHTSGNLRLRHTSPAIDAGNNSAPNIAGPDPDGLDRIMDGNADGMATIDIGAYEYPGCPGNPEGVLYVWSTQKILHPDGLSWTTALSDLQEALNIACSCGSISEIWVGGGTYYPGPAGNRLASFQLCNGVAVYGGFSGTETMRSQRDWKNHPVFLSGDIDHNDGPGPFENTTGNAYHVVTGSGTDHTAVLDGFTITAGRADGIVADLTGAGGGMLNNNGSPAVANCIFTENQAAWYGAGMANMQVSAPVLTQVIFSGNMSTFSGGGIYNQHGSPSVTNCIFSGNSSSLSGGGMYNSSGSPVITNSSFSGNSAGSAGGGGVFNSSGSPVITNCILWGNNTQITNSFGSSVVSYSIVQGGYAGVNNLNQDPLFVSQPPVETGASGDLRLTACSPAFNAGLSSANSQALDPDGHDRIVYSRIDMGAYEYAGLPCCDSYASGIIYVDHGATGIFTTGASWPSAFTGLQDALAAACNCDNVAEIWVAAGTYYPGSEDRRDTSFQLCNSTALYGGFNGSETLLSQRNWQNNLTILSGDIDGNDGPGLFDNNAGNAYRVVTGSGTDQSAVLDGFTITAGNANGIGQFNSGGGMYNLTGSPTISNCLFTGNRADREGGGMHNRDDANPVITNCTFSSNAAKYGGGMENNAASPLLTGCTFSGNSSGASGSGMDSYNNAGPVLIDCTFSGNTAAQNGGGLSNVLSSFLTISQCSFSNNTAGHKGAGIWNVGHSTINVVE